MKRTFLISLMFILSLGAICVNPAHSRSIINEQSENDSIENIVSRINLPVIHIITEDSIEPSCKIIEHPEGCVGHSITDNNYVKGHMKIHLDTMLVYDSGDYVKKKSGMRIKVRGNTSADFPYKSFKIKTEVKTDFFNREDSKYKSKSWVLLNLYSTRDLRTIAGCHVAKLLGIDWEPEHKFVNLFMNGEYRGLYMLSESVEASDGRCKLKDDSGLLIEADPYWWKEGPEDPVIKTNYLPYAIGYTFKNPELSVDDPMLDDIKEYLNAFEDSLYNGKDISKYIDMRSFATWILAHDILGTSDGAGSNIYLTKDDFLSGDEVFNSKLRMGPLWDFDSLFETDDKWCTCHDLNFFYYQELFKRPEFIEEYRNLWFEVHEDIANNTISFIKEFIEKDGEAIDESRRVSPPDRWVWRHTVNDNLTEIEKWFEKRMPWMEDSVSELLQAVSVAPVSKNSEITSVTIFDMSGRICKIYSGNEAARIFNSPRHKESISNLLNGIYIMKATYADGSTKSRRQII